PSGGLGAALHAALLTGAMTRCFEMSLQALLPAAIAKARASEAAALAANTAHAVHGAIGVTEEYDLQLYTRRLHGWRLAHGSEAYWHQVVGAALMGSGDGAVQFVRGL
ncbi:acyl-CoA dehydrogenase family protein, partial [Bordetella pertussis]|uniref:acyl-CoA dehydrogenase family protein n=1 Tax=Bordetella pertussis TaxID=520 RepID=UPI000B2544F2